MTNQKNKIVQNYLLQQLEYINLDQTQIWSVRHKILKKQFTLKKIKLKKEDKDAENQTSTILTEQKSSSKSIQWILQCINRQVLLLKRLNSQNGPKCHKMIKTTNNIYLVYDYFPQTTVQRHIQNKKLSLHEKIALILKISKSLLLLHKKNILLLFFSLANIYLIQQKLIFFSYWGLSTTLQSQHIINTDQIKAKSYENLPHQLIKHGKCSFGTDIYCLGTVFQNILKFQQNLNKNSIQYKLKEMISKMLSEEVINRPRLIDIIMQLEKWLQQTNKGTQVEQFVELQTLLDHHEELQNQKHNLKYSPYKNREGNILITIKSTKTLYEKQEQKKGNISIKMKSIKMLNQKQEQNKVKHQEGNISIKMKKSTIEKQEQNIANINEQQSSPKTPLFGKSQRFTLQHLNIKKRKSDLTAGQKSSLIHHISPSKSNIDQPSSTFLKTQNNYPSSPSPSTTFKSFKAIPDFSTNDALFYQKNSPNINKSEISLTKRQIQSINKQKRFNNVDILIKQFNKKRNLSIFLQDLSQYVMKMQEDFELSYLLIKYAIIHLSILIDQMTKYQTYPDLQKYSEIIKMEYSRLLQTKIPLEKYLLQHNSQNNKIIREISHKRQTSQRFLKQKIMNFSKQMILLCQKQYNNKAQSQLLQNNLFNTYMILKCIEEGSFQKFWEKIYQKQKLLLSNQKYLNDEKSLGIRYLKSRIAEIIKKK